MLFHSSWRYRARTRRGSATSPAGTSGDLGITTDREDNDFGFYAPRDVCWTLLDGNKDEQMCNRNADAQRRRWVLCFTVVVPENVVETRALWIDDIISTIMLYGVNVWT